MLWAFCWDDPITVENMPQSCRGIILSFLQLVCFSCSFISEQYGLVRLRGELKPQTWHTGSYQC